MADRKEAEGPSAAGPAEEAREVLRLLRKCRSRLNSLNLHHAAAYADISVQLLKQAIASQQQEEEDN